jgi:hypothetical protein
MTHNLHSLPGLVCSSLFALPPVKSLEMEEVSWSKAVHGNHSVAGGGHAFPPPFLIPSTLPAAIVAMPSHSIHAPPPPALPNPGTFSASIAAMPSHATSNNNASQYAPPSACAIIASKFSPVPSVPSHVPTNDQFKAYVAAAKRELDCADDREKKKRYKSSEAAREVARVKQRCYRRNKRFRDQVDGNFDPVKRNVFLGDIRVGGRVVQVEQLTDMKELRDYSMQPGVNSRIFSMEQ